MNNFQKTISILLIVLSTSNIRAQFYIGAGAGVFLMDKNIENSKSDNLNGLLLKSGYVHMFSKKFGIGTGIEYTQYSQTLSATNNFSYNTFLVDVTSTAFEYRVKTSGYSERQSLRSLQIPLFVQFKTLIEKGTHLYVRAGAKYLIPLQFKATATADLVEASGYYPDFNVLITDLPSRGFGAQSNFEESVTYTTDNAFLGSLELGFSFSIAKKSALYAGFYFDRALTSIIKNDSNNSFVGYSPISTTDRPLNGFFSSTTSTTLKPTNFGISLSYSFE